MGICYFPKDIESNPKSQVEYKKVAVVVWLIFQFNIYECNQVIFLDLKKKKVDSLAIRSILCYSSAAKIQKYLVPKRVGP